LSWHREGLIAVTRHAFRRFNARARIVLSCLIALVLFARQGVSDDALKSGLTIQNDAIRITFNERTGQLIEFTDKRNAHPFLNATSEDELWTLHVSSPSGETEIKPSMAKSFHYDFVQGKKDAVQLVWQDFGVAQAQGLRASATVTLSAEEPLAYWCMSLDETGDLSVRDLRFPRIQGVAPQENETLAVPVWVGQMTECPRQLLCGGDKPGAFEWEYPGTLSLQCAALYQRNGPGLFVEIDDWAAHAKRLRVFGEREQGLGFEVVNLPSDEGNKKTSYLVPYQVQVGVFSGDWFTVAERYRRWGLQQSWAESRCSAGLQMKGITKWVTDTGLWVWNRGRSDKVLGPALALQERAGVPVSVMWHWWHGCPYDIGFPEYLPPREGEAPFREAVRKAEQAGVHAIVYMNQRLWGMTTASWETEGAERYAVKGPDGKIHPEYYNTFKRAACASMCMGTEFWRNKYAGLAERALELGVDGIYMDQACSSLTCYDPTHGHPLGGGTYWMAGFRKLESDIRRRFADYHALPALWPDKGVVLAGEGCGEAWLPHLDLMLSLQVSMERYAEQGQWQPIPFFQAVYHGYAVQYGNYSSLTMPPYDELWPAESAPKEPLKLLDAKFSKQFRLEQARAFVWGQQPTIANFLPKLLDERPTEIAYAVKLAKIRMRALKYLLHGTMLRPPSLKLPEEEIDVSRLSIYAGQQGALKEYQKSYPPVLASAWKASDGAVGIVFANVSEKSCPISILLEKEAYDLPAFSFIFRIDADGSREVGPGKERRLDFTLAPEDACIYQFSKASVPFD